LNLKRKGRKKKRRNMVELNHRGKKEKIQNYKIINNRMNWTELWKTPMLA
jgi:hypothetical protein